VCERCGTALEAGTEAVYNRQRKKVRCIQCPSAVAGPPPVVTGTAGASARREYERRSSRRRAQEEARIARDAAWREQLKQERPVIGRVQAALTPKPQVGSDPQSTVAWAKGAAGEQTVGRLLDQWAAGGVGLVLHDRRIPRSKANIDHLAIAPNGVWAIDSKQYRGLVETTNRGGFFNADYRLKVNGRDQSKLADGVHRQMMVVAEALDRAADGAERAPVYGVLAFVGAEWEWFQKSFVFDGVTVVRAEAVARLLSKPGPGTAEQLQWTAAVLAKAFPPA
jgi:hypothetical protein